MFGITEPLDGNRRSGFTKRQAKTERYTRFDALNKFNVEWLATTDDPLSICRTTARGETP
ncbi:MAG: hypothetical protein ACLUSP_04230 [Christensenellales bacterium]